MEPALLDCHDREISSSHYGEANQTCSHIGYRFVLVYLVYQRVG